MPITSIRNAVLEKLHGFANQPRPGLTICLLRGDDGLGQEETLAEWESQVRSADYRRCLSLHDQYQAGEYSPISAALAKIGMVAPHVFTKVREIQENPYARNLTDEQGLSYSESLSGRVVEYCSLFNPAILVLHRMQAYPGATLRFWRDFLRHAHTPDRSTLLIADIYDDEEAKKLNNEWLHIKSAENFWHEFQECVTQIRFPRWGNADMKQYLHSIYPAGIKLDPAAEEKIFDAAHGNPLLLKKMLFLLESRGIIAHSDPASPAYCGNFDMTVIVAAVRDRVISRYEKLDPPLRNVLKKSALIGHVFNRNLLEYPLSIPNAYNQLRLIEEISQLICETRDDFHSFETRATWESIYALLPLEQDDYRDGNRVLGEYHLSLSAKEDDLLDLGDRASYSCKAAEHFHASGDIEKAIDALQRATHHYLSIEHFNDALKALGKSDDLYRCANIPPHSLHDYWRGDCLREVFRFSESAEAYKRHIDRHPSSNSAMARLMYASCLYNMSRMEEPRTIIRDLITTERRPDGTYTTPGILALALLAAIEETACNKSFKRYYFEALEAAVQSGNEVYYSLARRATMVFDGETAMPLLREAEEFFRKTGNRKELAMTLHNMATTSLFSGDLDRCGQWLRECMSIMRSYGSRLIHCTGNSVAILECLTTRNYRDALESFRRCDYPDMDIFERIVLRLNQATCLRNMKRFDECDELLSGIEHTLQTEECFEFNHQLRYLPLHRALLYFDMGQLDRAFSHIEEYWAFTKNLPRPKHYRDIMAVQVTIKLASALGKKIPPRVQRRKNANSKEVDRVAACGGLYSRLYFVEER